MTSLWSDKRIQIPVVAILVTVAIGGLYVVWTWQSQRSLEKKYRHNLQVLEAYLRDSQQIPTQDERVSLEQYQAFLQAQFQQIQERLSKTKDFAQAYAEVKRPLEFRQLIADISDKLNRTDIGFSDYEQSIPQHKDLDDLKKYLALIEQSVLMAKNNHIDDIRQMIRLPIEEVESYRKVMFRLYPVVLSVQARPDQFWKYLYDLSNMEALVLVKGLRVRQVANDSLLVDIKMVYVDWVA